MSPSSVHRFCGGGFFAKGNFEIIGQYYDVMEFAAM